MENRASKRHSQGRESRRATPRRLAVESLEKREVLAGNVTAALVANPDSGFDLVVTGDSANNGVKITQVGLGKYQVIGLPAGGPTTVNGMASDTISGVTADINVEGGGGNDRVVVQRAFIPRELEINTDGGNDHVNLVDISVKTLLEVETGGGDDTLSIQNVAVLGLGTPTSETSDTTVPGSAVQIDMGEGADTIDILRLAAGGGVGIDTGVGNDTLNIKQLAASNLTLLGDVGGDHLGKDTFTLTQVAVRNHIKVSMGDNQDSLSVTQTIAASAEFHGGSGTADNLHLAHNLFGSETHDGFETFV